MQKEFIHMELVDSTYYLGLVFIMFFFSWPTADTTHLHWCMSAGDDISDLNVHCMLQLQARQTSHIVRNVILHWIDASHSPNANS